MYLPSMPTIANDLALSDIQIKNTLTAWFLGASSIQFILGPISDRYGRKNVLVLGAAVFVLSSAVCASTSDLITMLIARFFQGLALCSLVAANAAIHELYSTKRAIKLMAIMGAVSILAPALGPLVGSLLVQFASWRYIFWLFVIMGSISFVSLVLFMPDTNNVKHPLHLKTIYKDYKRILTNKSFMLPNIAYSFLVAVFYFWMFESPFLIMETYGKSIMYYGFAQAAIFSCFFIGAAFTEFWLNRYSVISLIRFANALSIFSVFLLWLVCVYYSSMPAIVGAMMLIAFGTSMLFGPVNRVAIQASSQPMGRRTAVFSTTISLFGVFIGIILSILDKSSMLTVSILVWIYMMVAAVIIATIKPSAFKHEED